MDEKTIKEVTSYLGRKGYEKMIKKYPNQSDRMREVANTRWKKYRETKKVQAT